MDFCSQLNVHAFPRDPVVIREKGKQLMDAAGNVLFLSTGMLLFGWYMVGVESWMQEET